MIHGAVFHVEQFHKSPKICLLIVTLLGDRFSQDTSSLHEKIIKKLCMLFAVLDKRLYP